jgi:cell division protein FtsL
MAACTTAIYESGRGIQSQIAERNAQRLARQAALRRLARTPEIFFVKHIDNSRLVKAPDPVRARQIRIFSAAVVVLFSLIFFYGVQHFYALECSIRVEAEKHSVDQLLEENRQLRLTQAELADPARIDQRARSLGLNPPEPGQIVQSRVRPDANAPAEALAAPPPR